MRTTKRFIERKNFDYNSPMNITESLEIKTTVENPTYLQKKLYEDPDSIMQDLEKMKKAQSLQKMIRSKMYKINTEKDQLNQLRKNTLGSNRSG